MKHLAILAPLLLAGCAGGNTSGTLIDLKDDPNSGCGAVNYLGSAGGYVGHLGSARPNDMMEISITGCKISAAPAGPSDVATAVIQSLIQSGLIAAPVAPVAPVRPVVQRAPVRVAPVVSAPAPAGSAVVNTKVTIPPPSPAPPPTVETTVTPAPVAPPK